MNLTASSPSEQLGTVLVQATYTSYLHILYRKNVASCAPTLKKIQVDNLPCKVCYCRFILSDEVHYPILNCHSCLWIGWPLLPSLFSSAFSTWSSNQAQQKLSPQAAASKASVVRDQHVALCTQLDCFSCSRSVIIRSNTSGHVPVTGQARI